MNRITTSGRLTATILLGLLLVAARPAALAGESTPVILPATVQHDLSGGPGGAAYRLFIGLPPGYDPGGDTHYPVAYVLDGNVVFPFAVVTHRMFVVFNEAPETIVVGVGYPVRFFTETVAARWQDMTPLPDRALDKEQSARFGLDMRSGGAPEFLAFLRDEIIPYVDANYRTTQDRSLWGHSLGGLFALYTLFEAPELFRHYGISSPSLQFNEEAVLAQESAYAEQHRALPARAFVSLGSEENDISAHAARLIDVLEKREYADFVLRSHVFPDETHLSVFPAAFTRSLRFFYGSEAVADD